MNPKLKRAIAITGLVFMGLFLISMILYFIRPESFGGMLWLVAALCFGITLVLFFSIYFTHGFPGQQAKDEEFKRLEEAYYKKKAEQEADLKAEAEQESDDESEESEADKEKA